MSYLWEVYLPLIKKVSFSFTFHAPSRRGWTLVSNLKPFISFFSTTSAGTQAFIGDTILQIPELLDNVQLKPEKWNVKVVAIIGVLLLLLLCHHTSESLEGLTHIDVSFGWKKKKNCTCLTCPKEKIPKILYLHWQQMENKTHDVRTYHIWKPEEQYFADKQMDHQSPP